MNGFKAKMPSHITHFTDNYHDEEESKAYNELARAQVSLRHELEEAVLSLERHLHSHTSFTSAHSNTLENRSILPSLTMSSSDTNSDTISSVVSETSNWQFRAGSNTELLQTQNSMLEKLEIRDTLVSPTDSEKMKNKYAFFNLSDDDSQTASDDSSEESSLKIATIDDEYWSFTEVDSITTNGNHDSKSLLHNDGNPWVTNDPKYADTGSALMGPTEQGSGGLLDAFSRIILMGALGNK